MLHWILIIFLIALACALLLKMFFAYIEYVDCYYLDALDHFDNKEYKDFIIKFFACSIKYMPVVFVPYVIVSSLL